MKKFITTMLSLIALMLVAVPAFAQDGGAASADGYIALGAGLAIAIGALGGTMGQGRAAAAALEGIARNPGAASQVQTPMIIGLAMIESLVLFSLVIAFLLQAKIG